MPDFIIAYHGGSKPATPEAGAVQMQKWQAWLEGLGEAVVNPGTPLGKSVVVNPDRSFTDEVDNAMSGFSVVTAEDLEAALKIAQACPFLDTGGTLEVAQVMQMSR